jgi:outer membrane protein TolC
MEAAPWERAQLFMDSGGLTPPQKEGNVKKRRRRNVMRDRISAAWLGMAALLFLACFAMVPATWAVDAETQQAPLRLTLNRAIDMALAYNLDMKVAQEEIEAAQELKKEARTGFLPSLSGTYSYRRPSEVPYAVILDNQIDFADRDQYRFTGTVAQPLFTGFAILSNYQLAKLGLDVANLQLAQTRLDLILEAKEAFFAILTAEELREVAEQAEQQLQAELKVAEDFYRVGMSPKIDVLDAEVRLAEAEQQLIRAEKRVRLAEARMNTLLRQPIDQEIVVAEILGHQSYDKAYESCVEISLKERPELLEAEKNVARAEKEITLAKSDYFPEVSLSANYYRAGDEAALDGSDFVDRENWDVVAEATMTFFEWGKTRHATSEKRARLRQAKQAVEQIKDVIRLEVKTSYLNLETAEKNIWVAKKSVTSAEENFRISKERYKEQVATATEVLDAQTRLTEAKTNYTRALAEFNVALARLVRAMGAEEAS